MAEQVNASGVTIALDMKKSRIRIHKPTIHMLGDLKLIQLLFDPDTMVVAIVCPENEVPGGQEIHINPKYFKRGQNDVEVYSKMFLRKLRSIHGGLRDNCTYRLTGRIFPELRAARFPMSTIQRVECDEGEEVSGRTEEQRIEH